MMIFPSTFLGKYVSFSPPLRYVLGEELQFRKEATGNEMLILLQEEEVSSVQLDQWKLMLIPEREAHAPHQYCDNKKCVEKFKEFREQYFKDPELVECKNYDKAGFKAKYDYCKSKMYLFILYMTLENKMYTFCIWIDLVLF